MTGHLLGAARGATRQAPNRSSAASRDAIVVGDGGDFVSFAGRVWEIWEPGTWMDPGPYGCLGAGPGQAIGVLTDPEVVYPRRANLA